MPAVISWLLVCARGAPNVGGPVAIPACSTTPRLDSVGAASSSPAWLFAAAVAAVGGAGRAAATRRWRWLKLAALLRQCCVRFISAKTYAAKVVSFTCAAVQGPLSAGDFRPRQAGVGYLGAPPLCQPTSLRSVDRLARRPKAPPTSACCGPLCNCCCSKKRDTDLCTGSRSMTTNCSGIEWGRGSLCKERAAVGCGGAVGRQEFYTISRRTHTHVWVEGAEQHGAARAAEMRGGPVADPNGRGRQPLRNRSCPGLRRALQIALQAAVTSRLVRQVPLELERLLRLQRVRWRVAVWNTGWNACVGAVRGRTGSVKHGHEHRHRMIITLTTAYVTLYLPAVRTKGFNVK